MPPLLEHMTNTSFASGSEGSTIEKEVPKKTEMKTEEKESPIDIVVEESRGPASNQSQEVFTSSSLKERRRVSFTNVVEIIPPSRITNEGSSGNRQGYSSRRVSSKTIWYSKNELLKIHQQVNSIVQNDLEPDPWTSFMSLCRQEQPEKYRKASCTRGLERRTSQGMWQAQRYRRCSLRAVLYEQYQQRRQYITYHPVDPDRIRQAYTSFGCVEATTKEALAWARQDAQEAHEIFFEESNAEEDINYDYRDDLNSSERGNQDEERIPVDKADIYFIDPDYEDDATRRPCWAMIPWFINRRAKR